jgi:hypothetical protein
VIDHDALCDGEAEAGALSGRLGREEGIEDARQDIRRDARAFVGEGDLHLAVAPPARRDREGPPPVHRLERIAGEAEEDLAELAFIGEHERQRGVEIGDEPALGKPWLVAQELERLLDQDVDLRGRAAASGSRTNCRRLPVISLQR